MSKITTDREEAAKQLAQDAVKVWRHLRPTEKDEFRREAQRRIDRDGGVRVHETEDSTDAANYVGVAMRGRMDDIRALVAIAGGEEVSEKGAELLDLDHEELAESADDHLNALPLCIDRTVTFEIVLGTGGPDDRLLVECDWLTFPAEITGGAVDPSPEFEIRRIVYRYSWMGSGQVELQGDDERAAQEFARRVVPELSE